MDAILIPLLSVTVGLLIGLLGIVYFRGKDRNNTGEKNMSKSKASTKKSVQPMEFSKKILYSMFSLTLIIVACAIAMSYMTQTTDVYAYLIPSIFLELSVGTLFYYRKAEKENLLRESNRHELEMTELKSNNNEEDII